MFNHKEVMSNTQKENKVPVRNPSVPLRPNQKKVHFSEDGLGLASPTFFAPKFCSLLQLAEEMKAIRKAQTSSRSLPEMSRNRNLNFLPGVSIYQDLVDLKTPMEENVQQVRSQTCLKLKRDPDLDIGKYKYELEPEYFFASCAEPAAKTEATPFVFFGRSMCRNSGLWRELKN